MVFIHFILHLDHYLTQLAFMFGVWAYVILFALIFCETGLVITPFLPGDSLLFAAGAVAALGLLQPVILVVGCCLAAIAGNSCNYGIGRYLGPRVFTQSSRWLKRRYLDETHAFFEKYGAKTIILSRFLPILRTFAPFVAGIGSMRFAVFNLYNIIGALLWVCLLTGLGYWFGNLPSVKHNFAWVILTIIVISILPAIITAWKQRQQLRGNAS